MTDAIAMWLPSLLVSLVAVGAFLFLAKQSRSQIDQLKHSLRQASEQSTESFLQRESRGTLQRLQSTPADAPADPARLLAQMRHVWLEAELKALVDRGQRDSDHHLLQDAAAPLLRLAQRTGDAAQAGAAPWSSKDSQKYLKRTRDAVASQKQFIQEFRTRAAKMGNKGAPPAQGEAGAASEEPKQTARFVASMNHMESSTADLLQTIERLERELAAAQTKYDVIRGRLEALEAIRATRGAVAQANARLSTAKETAASNAEDRELLDDMESAYMNSMTEMKRMGEINRQQRHLILQMEKELSLLRKDTTEHQAASDVLGKLKLQLRDYENCTTILEMESDTLREQIQTLRRAVGAAGQAVEEAPPAPTAVATPGDDRDLLQLMARIAAAENLEKAGGELVAWLRGRDIASVVFLKTPQETIWLSSEGRVDEHSKQLLKSMVPVAGKPISEVREGVMFIFSTCRILLYGKGDFHERGGRTQQLLCDTFAAVDTVLQLFQDRSDLAHHHQQRARLQQKIQSLVVQYNYIDTEFSRALSDFRNELEEYLVTAEISAVQRDCIKAMLLDLDSQLDILTKTGKLVANGLKMSLQDLARIERNNAA